MPLGIIGDIHGQIGLLQVIVEETVPYNNISACIQIGDLGITSQDIRHYAKKNVQGFSKPTYFIDGNHEHFELFYHYTKVTEIIPNLFYVPRGTVMELDGRTVAFLGGASSIDKKMRLANKWHWDDRENIREEEVERLFKNVGDKKIDVFFAHIPPQMIIVRHFDPLNMLGFGVPITWVDHNAEIIKDVWKKLGKPTMICGHMHRSVEFENNSRILDINEFKTI